MSVNSFSTLVLTLSIGAAVAAVPGWVGAEETVPLKEAKLIIEHNATDNDTGFQGFIDGEGWDRIVITGPDGAILSIEGRGKLGKLGLTELFFESVEPEDADVPIDKVLATLPEGEYTVEGSVMEAGEKGGKTIGKAWLTHNIPAGPVLKTPADGTTVSADDVVMSWAPVTQTIKGTNVTIVSYQLIVEKDESRPNIMGKLGLSLYVPPSVTSVTLSKGILQPGTDYKWEVLAIEESGNQTLSTGAFKTK